MATIDDIKAAQARVTRLQAALDGVLTGRMRSGLDAFTAAGSNRISFFNPDAAELRVELAWAEATLARLQGDRSGTRRAL